MDLYINSLEKDKYKALNRVWIDMGLGSPHIAGLLFSLIEGKAFSTYEKWEKHYLQSGTKRLKLLQRYSEKFAEIAKNPGAQEKKLISWPVYKINYFHGRTQPEIDGIAATLYNQSVKESNIFNITPLDADNFVTFKLIGEPWNFELFRYSKTLTQLGNNFPDLQIRRARMTFVQQYGFQSFLMYDQKPRAGVFIKSPAWINLHNILYQLQDEETKKLDAYRNEFDTDIFILYSRVDGTIVNPDEVSRMASFQLQFN